MDLVVCGDLEAVAIAARERVATAAREAVERRGRFTLCLDGGRPTQRLLQLFSAAPELVDWRRTSILLGDDRRVPAEDIRSNRGMVERLLIAPLPIVPEFFAPDGAESDGEHAAAEYESVWRREVGPDGVDLLLLGMGPDGHTASIFPGSAALQETSRLVVAVPAPTTAEPKVPRLTLTPPTILAAKAVLLFAVGEEKRKATERLLAPVGSEQETPARLIRRRQGTTVVLADRAARGRGSVSD